MTFEAESFLQSGERFRLGFLPTEQSHPLTKDLSQWAQEDMDLAMERLRQVDLQALGVLSEEILTEEGYSQQVEPLRQEVSSTLKAGGRIFLGGCGATGRLCLSLEFLYRQQQLTKGFSSTEQVVAFTAGGDVALVHAIEGFEDHRDYGAEQLLGLGFSSKDLFIGCTEGGETPFVIGATLKAAEISRRPAFFIHCNPSSLLKEKIERSKEVLSHPKVREVSLPVGPMALAGSTRMQASTVMMLVLGYTLLQGQNKWKRVDLINQIAHLSRRYQGLNLKKLKELTLAEAQAYEQGHHTCYVTDHFAITIFTDTTERAPTFSLPPFNNFDVPQGEASLSYVMIPSGYTRQRTWSSLLGRQPRCLDWLARNSKTTAQYLNGFDFGSQALLRRQQLIKGRPHHTFVIDRPSPTCVLWRFRGREWSFAAFSDNELWNHLLLKMLLNMHSTLVMGRLGRYSGNLMTWVKPTNGKLIDRATRYAQELLERQGLPLSYEEVVKELFEQLKSLGEKESVVEKTVQSLLSQNNIHRAYSTACVSLTTVTLISPG